MPAGNADSRLGKPAAVLLGLLLLAAAAVRFYQLDLRPLHSDEGGNYWFIKEVLRGGIYHYSHLNYHGPLFFYLAALAVKFCGLSVFSLRLVPALCGTALVLLPLLLRKQLGINAVIISALLLALSPSLVFFSRYSIHEVLFVLCQLSFAAAVFRLFDENDKDAVYLAGAALSLMICLKETFVIGTAAAVLSAAAVFPFVQMRNVLTSHFARLILTALAAIAGICFIYTAGGRWQSGIAELAAALPQWIKRGTASDPGHFKNWSFYLTELLIPAEPWLVVGIVFSCLVLASRKIGRRDVNLPDRDGFFKVWGYLLIFSLLQLIIYSAIPYKTPWLVVNLSCPLILNLACFIAWILQLRVPLGRMIALCLAIVFASGSAFQTGGYCFRPGPFWERLGYRPYGEGNPFSYVHTLDGMLEMVRLIDGYKLQNPKANILIAVPGYWPLPFYLRHYEAEMAYQDTEDLAPAALTYSVIVGSAAADWRSPEFDDYTFKLSDFQDCRLFLRKDLR